MDYFKKQRELLHLERDEDKNAYRLLMAGTSVAERRGAGMAWYPVAIRGTEMGRGDYLTVEVERTTQQDITHQLRFGAAAALFSHHDPKHDRLEGVITWQSGHRLKLSLRTDELPDWADNGKLGIDMLFDDNSYDEMEAALREAETRKDKGNEGHLIKVLLGEKPATFHDERAVYEMPRLNPSQQAAVGKIIKANEIAIVHGPPGTGKTTTLVQAIKALWKEEHQPILVVAPSNTAVDLLSERLSAEGLQVLRVGNPARVSAHLMSLTLDARVAEHASMKEIRSLKKQANEFRDMAHKYKRNFGKAEREQRKALFTEARNIMKSVGDTEQYIINDVIARAQVIAATLVGANHYTVRDLRYKTVVIDEAGQALEPACWIPILKARKVVLAGDHQQLPPTIKSGEAARRGLQTTLLEKCVAWHPEAVVMLEEQYRMHTAIMGYAAASFYNSRLRAHASVAGHTLFENDAPLAFIDTAGCGFEEKQDGASTANPEEAAFLFKHLGRLAEELDTHYAVEAFPSIAVISPYRQQVELLKAQLQHSPGLHKYGNRIQVNTIDSFQGQERDIVYISMTRSNTENKIGFLNDTRRMNVAMTRARKKLVVVGDSGTLSQWPFYADFIAYTEQQHAYQSAWEFMD